MPEGNSQVLAGRGVDFLGIQQRPGEGQKLLAQGVRPLGFADHGQRGHQPERAYGERALLAGASCISH